MRTASNKKVTSKDVAKLAGVSQSTVSRAFNASTKLNQELRERVMLASRELGYQPNRLAQSLSNKKTGIIAIVSYTLDSPFISKAINLLVIALQHSGLQSLVFVPKDEEDVDLTTDYLLQYQVDAVIILGAKSTTKMAKICDAYDTPVVLFSRFIPYSNTNAVCCNDRQCGIMAADILFQSGCRSFAFINAKVGSSTNTERHAGFAGRLRELGIDTCAQVSGGMTYQDGLNAGKEIMELPTKIDGCFCGNDVSALGALSYLKDVAKLRVPEDISIIGFDDIDMASYLPFQLSTFQEPLEDMVDATVETIQSAINNPNHKPILKIIEGHFIKRNTTK